MMEWWLCYRSASTHIDYHFVFRARTHEEAIDTGYNAMQNEGVVVYELLFARPM